MKTIKKSAVATETLVAPEVLKRTSKEWEALTDTQLRTEMQVVSTDRAARSKKSEKEAFIAYGVKLNQDAYAKAHTLFALKVAVIRDYKAKFPSAYYYASRHMDEVTKRAIRNLGGWIEIERLTKDADGNLKPVREVLACTWAPKTDKSEELALDPTETLIGFNFAAAKCASKQVTTDDMSALNYVAKRTESIVTETEGQRIYATYKDEKGRIQNKTHEVEYTFYPRLCGGTGKQQDIRVTDGKVFYTAIATAIYDTMDAHRNDEESK